MKQVIHLAEGRIVIRKKVNTFTGYLTLSARVGHVRLVSSAVSLVRLQGPYAWTETTEVSDNTEVRDNKRRDFGCR